MMTSLLGRVAGFSPAQIEGILDLYTLELFQDGYRPSTIAALRAARTVRRRKVTQDQDLLKKVERFSITEDEAKATTAAAKKQKNRRR